MTASSRCGYCHLDVSLKEVTTTIKRIRSVIIKGHPWSVRWPKKLGPTGHYLGYCWRKQKMIEIADNQPEKETVDTVIHEMLHGEFPKAPERKIAEVASELTDALFRMGCFEK